MNTPWSSLVLIVVLMMGMATVEGMNTSFHVAQVQFDKDVFSIKERGVARVIDADENQNSNAIESVDARLWSTTDRKGLSLTLVETCAACGIFESIISLTSSGSSFGNTLRVSQGDTISLLYVDRTTPAGGSENLFASALVKSEIPSLGQGTPGVSSKADILVTVKAKKKVTLLAIKNNSDLPIYSFEIKGLDGSIRFIKVRDWDREKIDQNTVAIGTDDNPITRGQNKIVLLILDRQVSALEWQAFSLDAAHSTFPLTEGIIVLTPITYDAPPRLEPTLACSGVAACFTAIVTKIVDGDTFDVTMDNNTVRLRLALTNTPERGEPLYNEATKFTATLCSVGSTVVIDEDDGQREGSFDRIIAKVYCADQILNLELLRAGLAVIDTRFCEKSEFGKEVWAQRFGCEQKAQQEQPPTLPSPAPSNRSPVADAGTSQTVNEGMVVMLDGRSSSDPDGDTLSYLWRQIAGASVRLQGANTANPSFTAPFVNAETTLTFELTVSDGALSSTDTVSISVKDMPPPSSFAFEAWDNNMKSFEIKIQKTAKDKATILINNERYEASNLKKDQMGTVVKGTVSGFSITLQINCDSKQSTFTLSALFTKKAYYLQLQDCQDFVSWVKNDDMPLMV